MAKKRPCHHLKKRNFKLLLDFAAGLVVFEGRDRRPRNQEVLRQIAALKACEKKSEKKSEKKLEKKPVKKSEEKSVKKSGKKELSDFVENKSCSCGWHYRAAARKEARKKVASGMKQKNQLISE